MAPKPAEAVPRMDGRPFSQRSPWPSATGAPVPPGRLFAKPPEAPLVLSWLSACSCSQASWSCSLTFSGCCSGPGTGCGKTALPPNEVPPRPASDSSRPPWPGRAWCTPRTPPRPTHTCFWTSSWFQTSTTRPSKCWPWKDRGRRAGLQEEGLLPAQAEPALASPSRLRAQAKKPQLLVPATRVPPQIPPGAPKGSPCPAAWHRPG